MPEQVLEELEGEDVQDCRGISDLLAGSWYWLEPFHET